MSAKYIFRLDDITPTMDWDNFYRLMDFFEKYSIKPLLGIIPFNKDPKLNANPHSDKFWDIMRELHNQNKAEFAQHGYEHLYVTNDRGILGKCYLPQSEFAGLGYQEQYNKIVSGRKILQKEGIYTDIWMAPAHTMDLNTVKALAKLGFKMVTDGIAVYPYCYKGLLFVPQQLWEYRYWPMGVATICLHINDQSEDVISGIEKAIKRGIITVPFSSMAGAKTTLPHQTINHCFRIWFLARKLFEKYKYS